jgi:sulfur carrier protein ThiS
MVEICVFGDFWEHLDSRLQLDLEGCDVTVADLLARLGLDPSGVGIVTMDGRQSRLDELVPASCRVCIFPLMSGG